MKRVILIVMVILGWSTFAIRLFLRITESDFSVFESTVQYFSFFTILTNLFVTIYCTHLLIKKRNKNSFLDTPEAITALTVYILIVGIVYHIALKPIWNPEGLLMVLSEIHHTIIPIGTLILWLLSETKDVIKIKDLFSWLLYPVIYIVFVLFRGSFSNFYPYPFLDVTELGIVNVITNSAFLLLFMVVMLFLFFLIGKKISKKNIK